jgi:hypothetical protein
MELEFGLGPPFCHLICSKIVAGFHIACSIHKGALVTR